MEIKLSPNTIRIMYAFPMPTKIYNWLYGSNIVLHSRSSYGDGGYSFHIVDITFAQLCDMIEFKLLFSEVVFSKEEIRLTNSKGYPDRELRQNIRMSKTLVYNNLGFEP